MKQTPPIPPNNPRFRDDILYSGCIYYLCPGTQLIHLNGDRDEIPIEWIPIIAADAEVSFRKEENRLLALAATADDRPAGYIGELNDEYDAASAAAIAWRFWAEPESEEADNGQK